MVQNSVLKGFKNIGDDGFILSNFPNALFGANVFC